MFIRNSRQSDRSQEIPMTHFLLLGSYGDETQPDGPHGTWNAGDIAITYGQKTKKENNMQHYRHSVRERESEV